VGHPSILSNGPTGDYRKVKGGSRRASDFLPSPFFEPLSALILPQVAPGMCFRCRVAGSALGISVLAWVFSQTVRFSHFLFPYLSSEYSFRSPPCCGLAPTFSPHESLRSYSFRLDHCRAVYSPLLCLSPLMLDLYLLPLIIFSYTRPPRPRPKHLSSLVSFCAPPYPLDQRLKLAHQRAPCSTKMKIVSMNGILYFFLQPTPCHLGGLGFQRTGVRRVIAATTDGCPSRLC